MLNIMVIEFENFLNTSIFDKISKKYGIKVLRPKNPDQIFTLSEKIKTVLVFYYNFNQLKWLIPILEKLDEKQIHIINPLQSIKNLTNYHIRSIILSKNGIEIPEFYYGKTNSIPEVLGDKIIYKSQENNIVVSCKKNSIHSLYDNIFVESQIPNPSKKILTLYNIAGMIYGRWKEDALQTKNKDRSLIDNIAKFKRQIYTTKKIGEIFNLTFYNVEFIKNCVIDVNSISNFFYNNHLEPIIKLIEHIKRQN